MVGQGAPDDAARDHLDHAGDRVDHHEHAVGGRHEGSVETGGELARLPLGVSDEHRELMAAGLLGRADGPVDLEPLGGGEVTSCHWHHPFRRSCRPSWPR